MAYQWNSSLETGYDKIDNQHRQLIAAVNTIVEASSTGKDGDRVVLDTLDFLTGYAIKHFADEEQLQIDYQYPDYLNHKKLHDEFKVVVGDLVQQVSKDGPTPEIIDLVCTTIGDWLYHHIQGDDFRMAVFVKTADEKAMAESE